MIIWYSIDNPGSYRYRLNFPGEIDPSSEDSLKQAGILAAKQLHCRHSCDEEAWWYKFWFAREEHGPVFASVCIEARVKVEITATDAQQEVPPRPRKIQVCIEPRGRRSDVWWPFDLTETRFSLSNKIDHVNIACLMV